MQQDWALRKHAVDEGGDSEGVQMGAEVHDVPYVIEGPGRDVYVQVRDGVPSEVHDSHRLPCRRADEEANCIKKRRVRLQNDMPINLKPKLLQCGERNGWVV